MTAMTDAQRELASDPRAMQMARAVAGNYAEALPHLYTEIRSAADWGLVQAALSYDLDLGIASFTTYARARVVGQVRDDLRKLLPRGFQRSPKRVRPIVIPLCDCDEPVVSPTGCVEAIEAVDLVEALLARVPYGCRRFVLALLAEGGPGYGAGVAVARRLGVTPPRVVQLMVESADRMRAEAIRLEGTGGMIDG